MKCVRMCALCIVSINSDTFGSYTHVYKAADSTVLMDTHVVKTFCKSNKKSKI